MQQDGKWVQMPLAFPLRTGVGMLDGVTAKSSGRDEISTLMTHAELALRVKLPGRFSFRISWYQGIEGFTGWHGGTSLCFFLLGASSDGSCSFSCMHELCVLLTL